MDQIVNVAHLSEQDRFDFWRDEVSKQHLKYDVDRIEWDTPFQAELQAAVLGEVLFSEARLSAIRGERTKQHIASDSMDHYVLAMPIKHSVIRQDSIDYVLGENEMVLFDGTRPLSYQHDDNCGGIMIAIPRHCLESKLKSAEVKGPRVAPLDYGVGLIVRSFCQALPDALKSNPDANIRQGLSEQLISLAALAFQASEQGMNDAQFTLSHLRFQAVKDFIDSHIQDPDLSPNTVVQAMGISRSYLYKLLASNDFSFQQYVRVRRLNRVATDLRNLSLRASSITDIAMGTGFSSMSHFSRCFTSQFAETPRSYRARMQNSGG